VFLYACLVHRSFLCGGIFLLLCYVESEDVQIAFIEGAFEVSLFHPYLGMFSLAKHVLRELAITFVLEIF